MEINEDIYKEMEKQINYLYNPCQSIANINKANTFLFSFIKLENFSHLRKIFADASNINIKIYAASGLTELITKYYLSIPSKEIEEIYSYIISYLVSGL